MERIYTFSSPLLPAGREGGILPIPPEIAQQLGTGPVTVLVEGRPLGRRAAPGASGCLPPGAAPADAGKTGKTNRGPPDRNPLGPGRLIPGTLIQAVQRQHPVPAGAGPGRGQQRLALVGNRSPLAPVSRFRVHPPNPQAGTGQQPPLDAHRHAVRVVHHGVAVPPGGLKALLPAQRRAQQFLAGRRWKKGRESISSLRWRICQAPGRSMAWQ